MVKFFSTRNVFEHKWETVSLAVWMKYPNPFSTHVLAADVLNRYIDPETGCLHTTRLILKTGSMPSWVLSILKSPDAYIIEESIVDPKTCYMQTRTRNLTHRRFMAVEEIQTYTKNPDEQSWTLADCRVIIKSNFGAKWSGLAAKIEGLGVKRFTDHFPKSQKAMTYILDKLRNREKIS